MIIYNSAPRICANHCLSAICPYGRLTDNFGCPHSQCLCRSPCEEIECKTGDVSEVIIRTFVFNPTISSTSNWFNYRLKVEVWNFVHLQKTDCCNLNHMPYVCFVDLHSSSCRLWRFCLVSAHSDLRANALQHWTATSRGTQDEVNKIIIYFFLSIRSNFKNLKIKFGRMWNSRQQFSCMDKGPICPTGFYCTGFDKNALGVCCPGKGWFLSRKNEHVWKIYLESLFSSNFDHEQVCKHGDPFSSSTDGVPFTCTVTANGYDFPRSSINNRKLWRPMFKTLNKN